MKNHVNLHMNNNIIPNNIKIVNVFMPYFLYSIYNYDALVYFFFAYFTVDADSDISFAN